ncbi:unnamed protein product [[Candida] boidinii]|uniref:Unnamed protein product n=1 Tax=Candida boidinii TaxID=5477 RepID=A0A9W6SU03_CANBO|nr:hypothetical protein B5S30_g2777 [[Candida] boidinii]GME67211.1 unnamed protein product [[Candida] boidinii]
MSQHLEDQSQVLPRNKLFITLSCLTTSLFVSFFDQTAVTTAIPSIASDLNSAGLITSWIGTSYLITNTNFQLLYGRFSDIFGRKQVFLFTLGCLLVGNFVSGFSQNPIMLFVFRGISGIGGGGINCLVMITFSDLLTTRQRGKYFGFVAVSTSLGNGVGPLIGGALSQKASWRWVFWISCPICVAAGVLVILFVPLKPVTSRFQDKLKIIDWYGFLFSTISTILLLVAISGGGQQWKWNSPTFIVLIVISGISSILFFYCEGWRAEIPMIPLTLFRNIHSSLLFTMCLLMGWCYFVDIYYFPIYLQDIRGWSPIIAGVIQLPATCSSSIFGVLAGYINSKTGHYVRCLWFGGVMWAVGTGLKILFARNSNIGLLVGSNLIQGLGIGFTFQPTLLALLSHTDSKDRAIVTGLRNFFRCFGGAIGLIVSGIIFKTILQNQITKKLNDNYELVQKIMDNFTMVKDLDIQVQDVVLDSYLYSFKIIMITLTVMSGFMFALSLFTKDGSDEDDQEEPNHDNDENDIAVKEYSSIDEEANNNNASYIEKFSSKEIIEIVSIEEKSKTV